MAFHLSKITYWASSKSYDKALNLLKQTSILKIGTRRQWQQRNNMFAKNRIHAVPIDNKIII